MARAPIRLLGANVWGDRIRHRPRALLGRETQEGLQEEKEGLRVAPWARDLQDARAHPGRYRVPMAAQAMAVLASRRGAEGGNPVLEALR